MVIKEIFIIGNSNIPKAIVDASGFSGPRVGGSNPLGPTIYPADCKALPTALGSNPESPWVQFEIRGSNNRLVKSAGGFATEKEARAAGGEQAKKLRGSQGWPGGTEVLSVMAGQKPTTTVPFGVAGAKLEAGGRIEGIYGLKGRMPSPGYSVCSACDGSGHGPATTLVEVPCPQCGGAGDVNRYRVSRQGTPFPS